MKAFQTAFGALRPFTLLVLAAGAVSCGEEDDDKPPPPPTLQIQSIDLSGGAHWARGDGGTPELELGCAPEQLTVTVGPSDSAYMLGDWELRPVASCGSDNSCGYLVLSIDGSESSVERLSARRFIELSSDELPGTGRLGLRVELVDDAGLPIETELGPVTAELDLVISRAVDCDDASAATDG